MKQSGVILISNPDSGQQLQELPTVACVHCGFNWVPQPGSGKVRGWCTRCNGPVCGPGCAECVPKEQQMLNMEMGRAPRTPGPTQVNVPSVPWFSGGF